MNTSQHPTMTVTGIHKSQGDFANDAGKNIEFSNTVVTVLQDYLERELEQGAIGKKTQIIKSKVLNSLMIIYISSYQRML